MADPQPELRAVFCEALDLGTPEQQADYLDHACEGKPELRARVDALLRAQEQASAFLHEPPGSPAATMDEPIRERPGTLIGPYKLLEQIGEGGFGVVFMAEQTQPVRRRVALKVLKPGMDTRQVVARFEAERQALALMEHPNIARIFDGGETVSGRPYFVMELVRGISITDFCDQNHLSVRARLDLFVSVCQAVQHAHQKGIIHRDLKPSNVLVTLHDGVPLAKVIDFGIAKATGQQLTEKTLFTNFAAMIGTPMYMSPEQAQMSAVDVDTRSDIYSLGVLPYELLTGTTPFDKERLRTAAFDEIRRMIREEEPVRPSTRLSTMGQAAETISANRHSDPRRLSQLCRGELDWIVMKCLEKDRNRRYETTNGLAMDVHRYLADEPVQACPPSAWYRFRKFARRHKAALLGGTAVALTVLASVIGLAVSNVYISREKAQKEEALAEAEANLLLARQAVDEIYTPVADQLSLVPHMQPFQREVILKARDFYQEFAKRKSSDPAIRLESAHAALYVLQIQYSLGKLAQHEAACRALLASLQQLEPERSLGPKHRLYVGETMSLLAAILTAAGRGQEAEQYQRQVLALYGEVVAECPDVPKYRIRLIQTHNMLGLLQQDRPYEAEQNIGKAIRHCEELVNGWPNDRLNHGELVHSYYLLGYTLAGMDRLQEAEDALRKAIAVYEKVTSPLDRSAHRAVLPLVQHQLGRVLVARGRFEEAVTAERQAVVLGEKIAIQFPDIPPYRRALAHYYLSLAKFLVQTGRRDEAAKFGSLAIELTERLTAEFEDDTQPRDQSINELLAMVVDLRDAGELLGAERACRKALELAKAVAGDSPNEAGYQYRLAEVYAGLGTVLQRARRFREAADAYREYLAICDKLAAAIPADPDYRYYQARADNFLGVALRYLPKEVENAPPHHRKALKLCEQLNDQFPKRLKYGGELVRSHYALGLALQRIGNLTEAEVAFRKAIAASDPSMDRLGDPPITPSVHNDLAWLLATRPEEKLRNPREAVELARKAVARDPRPGYWNTLGATEYRAGNFKEALAALEKSMQLRKGGDSFDWFFLAMTHQQLSEKKKAREWYDRAVEWMEKNQPKNEELRRFRIESAELLEVKEKK